MDDILDELAQTHRQARLAADAQGLANSQGKAVQISRLTSTQAPKVGDLLSPTCATCLASRIRIGPSPVTTWFLYEPGQGLGFFDVCLCR